MAIDGASAIQPKTCFNCVGVLAIRAACRCSVITAGYERDGELVGSLGVIGPTRMAYERVIPIIDITARLLSSALTQRGT